MDIPGLRDALPGEEPRGDGDGDGDLSGGAGGQRTDATGGTDSGSGGAGGDMSGMGGAGTSTGGDGGGEEKHPWDCGGVGDVLFEDDFENGDGCWTANFGGNWELVPGEGYDGSIGFRQPEEVDGLRVMVSEGPDAGWENVRLQARVKILRWGSSSPSQNDVLGLFARYTSDENMVYAGVLGNAKLQPRKFTDGTDQSIGDSYVKPTAWEIGRWYELAVEVEDGWVRIELDGNVVSTVEDTDSSRVSNPGQVAIGTVRDATAVFDDVVVTRL